MRRRYSLHSPCSLPLCFLSVLLVKTISPHPFHPNREPKPLKFMCRSLFLAILCYIVVGIHAGDSWSISMADVSFPMHHSWLIVKVCSRRYNPFGSKVIAHSIIENEVFFIKQKILREFSKHQNQVPERDFSKHAPKVGRLSYPG